MEEAQKLCFPSAERFEKQLLNLNEEQLRTIERKSGAKLYSNKSHLWFAWRGEEMLGAVVLDKVIGKHEFIDYVVALNPQGVVQQIEILEYRESYGGEVRGEKWRKQFVGKKRNSSLKLNGDIYNISGATLSCRSVTEGVKRVVTMFDLYCRPQFVSTLRVQQSSAN